MSAQVSEVAADAVAHQVGPVTTGRSHDRFDDVVLLGGDDDVGSLGEQELLLLGGCVK